MSKEKKIHYRIEDEKIIYNPTTINEKELKEIKKLHDVLGYSLIPQREKREVDETKHPKITEAEMRAYLEEHATKAQKKEFEEKYNAPMIDKKTGKQAVTKKGKPRVKGFIAVYHWFIKNFPNYPEAPAEK